MHRGHAFRAVWVDRCGAIAPIFALTLLVLMGGLGLSVDGARVYAAKQRMQATLDGAVLAAARRAIADNSTENVPATFDAFLSVANFDDAIRLKTIQPDFSRPRQFSATVDAEIDMTFMRILGFKALEVHAQAAAEFGFTKLEIALALDNTGSMAGAKLDALKTSAKRLVDTLLEKAANDGDVRISLVPFAQYVNVGTENRYASWMDVADDYSETKEYCADHYPVTSSGNCRTVQSTHYQDGTPVQGSYQQCDNTYGQPVYQCSTYTSHHAWQGCVGSRAYPLNIQDGTYTTRIPGLMNVSCPSRIQPLTSSRGDLTSAIDAMVASGDTYVPSGLMWGWRALTTKAPYGESAGDHSDGDGNRLNKVLILMTDGANTRSPAYPAHDGSDASLANSLTSEACNAIKGSKIQIFTIAFEVTDPAIKSLMRSCATTADRFFDASGGGGLDAAMQAISGQLGGLRLTN
jgi:hypothetical protein